MYDQLVDVRNRVIGGIYRQGFRRIFFRLDPESVHERVTAIGETLGRLAVTRRLARFLFNYRHPALCQTIRGLRFVNPVGLAAGFDKNARLTRILPAVGFGFAEVGSVTGEPCAGNRGRRLWRLPRSRSLVVYYGLLNDGCEVVAGRLQRAKRTLTATGNFPLGVSIAKTNCAATAETATGIADYVKAFKKFNEAGVGDYYTINISCPNAYGGQPFTDAARLEALLAALETVPSTRPIFLKLSPDLLRSEIDDIVTVSQRHRVGGFICSNLTKRRDSPRLREEDVPAVGGLSGKVVEPLADELIKYIYHATSGRYIIIGCGGIFSAADAYKKICLGASLLQLITGMIYEGPQVVSEINRGLVHFLTRDGFTNIAQAVGVDNK